MLWWPLIELSQAQEKQPQSPFPAPEKSPFWVDTLSSLRKGSVKLWPNHVEIVARREVEREEEFCWIEEGAENEPHSRV